MSAPHRSCQQCLRLASQYWQLPRKSTSSYKRVNRAFNCLSPTSWRCTLNEQTEALRALCTSMWHMHSPANAPLTCTSPFHRSALPILPLRPCAPSRRAPFSRFLQQKKKNQSEKFGSTQPHGRNPRNTPMACRNPLQKMRHLAGNNYGVEELPLLLPLLLLLLPIRGGGIAFLASASSSQLGNRADHSALGPLMCFLAC